MGQILSHTYTYYSGLFHYLWGDGRYKPYQKLLLEGGGSTTSTSSTFRRLEPEPTDTPDKRLFKRYARIHLYTLASNFYLYDKPHYRKGTYREDLVDNLRNVAIPGTGIPLSLVAANRWVGLGFLLTAYPAVSLVASIHECWIKDHTKTAEGGPPVKKSSISEEYATRLLAPDDWFSYWRLNCIVAGLHAVLNDTPIDYEMENKWTFLEEGDKRGVPVSPFLKTEGIVVKHRNEEGGLGIYFYKNATAGGDWIIQERIENSPWVSSLLPDRAPLSTFRVLTCSRASIDMSKDPKEEDVTALSCVFRAGRAGASTDHDSILFDVGVKSGEIKGGTTNAHWYRLGLNQILPGQCPWRSSHSYKNHPDGDIKVTGNKVPDMKSLLALATKAHLTLCPRTPFAGWDVVLSADPKIPMCLLEVNLSCNFFRGSFDKQVYVDFIDDALVELQALRLEADSKKKVFKVA